MNSSSRVHNFSAGPCTLPVPVLEAVQNEMLNFENSGMSIIESSHRAPEYDSVHMSALSDFRSLAGVPDDFAILFLQGGASLQFTQIPLNLLSVDEKAGYLNTGTWGGKALSDAKLMCSAYEAWSGADSNFSRMPDASEIEVEEGSRFLHITTNETIGGIQLPKYPKIDFPMVADMSSDFLSRSIDWECFDLVYGGAQKNLGPSGLTIVVVREEIFERSSQVAGGYLDYQIHAKADSMANTPPMFPIYVMGKVLKWMIEAGGLPEFEKRAHERASVLYDTIDNSGGWYQCPVDTNSRSLMNIVFRLPNEDLEKKFITEASDFDLVNLKGHRSVGGVRASVYNALPLESAQSLADFMTSFQQQNG